jgi:hypothetical protein
MNSASAHGVPNSILNATPRNARGAKFFIPCSIILLFTATAKIVSALGESHYLGMPSFVAVVSNRQLLFGAGVVEVWVACILLGQRGFRWKVLAVAWFSTCCMAWRLGLKLGHYGVCHCLGTAYQWIPLSERTINEMLLALLGFMVVGSFWMLVADLVRSRSTGPSALARIFRPSQRQTTP